MYAIYSSTSIPTYSNVVTFFLTFRDTVMLWQHHQQTLWYIMYIARLFPPWQRTHGARQGETRTSLSLRLAELDVWMLPHLLEYIIVYTSILLYQTKHGNTYKSTFSTTTSRNTVEIHENLPPKNTVVVNKWHKFSLSASFWQLWQLRVAVPGGLMRSVR